MLKLDVPKLCHNVRARDRFRTAGKLRSATGVILSCTLPAAVGDQCCIISPGGREILAEVIGFNNGLAYLVPYEQGEELSPGMTVLRRRRGLSVPVGDGLLGRIVDGLGRPLDNRGPLVNCEPRSVSQEAPAAMDRARIREPFVTGQRALDGLLTIGRGQRVGIFAGSGVGKSTLLGEIAKGCEADVNVIALIGERGREVRPFLDDCVGAKGMEKSVVVVATCDQTPLMRVRASQVAITIADHYRAAGKNVLLMLDSLTRLAMAQRELGLALGEPPSARGYTPSCFQLLANTVERLGNAAVGTVTGILTVLVDGGDMDEPISDAVRSLVDGHFVLDRRLAERGQYPAISISQSISRVAQDVTDAEHQKIARKMREILATYAEGTGHEKELPPPLTRGPDAPRTRSGGNPETEQLVREWAQLHEREDAVAKKEQQPTARRQNLEIIKDDIKGEREAIDKLRKELNEQAEGTKEELANAERKVKQIEQTKDEQEKLLNDAKRGVYEAENLRAGNVKRVSGIADTAEPAEVAVILERMIESGNTGLMTAAQILASMKDRRAAQVLSAMQDKNMAADLLEKMVGLKQGTPPGGAKSLGGKPERVPPPSATNK